MKTSVWEPKFKPGQWVAIKESNRIVLVETINKAGARSYWVKSEGLYGEYELRSMTKAERKLTGH